MSWWLACSLQHRPGSFCWGHSEFLNRVIFLWGGISDVSPIVGTASLFGRDESFSLVFFKFKIVIGFWKSFNVFLKGLRFPEIKNIIYLFIWYEAWSHSLTLEATLNVSGLFYCYWNPFATIKIIHTFINIYLYFFCTFRPICHPLSWEIININLAWITGHIQKRLNS